MCEPKCSATVRSAVNSSAHNNNHRSIYIETQGITASVMITMLHASLWKLLVLLVFIIGVNDIVQVGAFNIDTSVPIVKQGAANSYFGFSSTVHRIRHLDKYVILVGAPRHDGRKPTEKLTGIIFQCQLTSQLTDCTPVDIDWQFILEDRYNSTKIEDQWMGVSVASDLSSGGPGDAIACAHRHRVVDTVSKYDWGKGVCLIIGNNLTGVDHIELDPCSNYPDKLSQFEHEMCQCQAGVSLAIGLDRDILIGSPGTIKWRGSLNKYNFQTSIFDDSIWYNSPALDITPRQPWPEPATTYYSYLGMAVKIGHILPGEKTYVGGSPRSEGKGQVILFQPTYVSSTYLLKPIVYLTGEQFGSGFGYDLAIGDFNGDGKEDLVVGAPFLFGPGIGGAIYIYVNGRQGTMSSSRPIRVTSRTMKTAECVLLRCEDARFGFAIANAGDLDKDGFQDFVVGAPFEGSGAVYVFSGLAQLADIKYSQRIYAADVGRIPSGSLTSFGYSFQNSPGLDLDNNGYPDVIVGAYASSMMLVLRTKPVVVVTATLSSHPESIDPKITQCSKDGNPNNCFDIRICLRMTAEPKDRFRSALNITYRLEAEKFTGVTIVRVYFKGQREDAFFVQRNVSLLNDRPPECFTETVYVKKPIRDILSSVHFQLTYSLLDKSQPRMSPGQPLVDLNRYPVISPSSSQPLLLVPFVKNCGSDEICHSQLLLTVSVPDITVDASGAYTLKVGKDASKSSLTLNVEVVNNGEDAHDTTVDVSFPSFISFDGSDEQGKLYSCTASENIVICSLGNPFREGQRASFQLTLSPTSSAEATDDCNITINARTTSNETDKSDDVRLVKLRIQVDADLALLGSSDPSRVTYSKTLEGASPPATIEQIGPPLKHTYEVRNEGSVKMSGCTLRVSWPGRLYSSSHQQRYLLYLTEPPDVDNEQLATCKYDESAINPSGMQVSSSYRLPTARPNSEEEVASSAPLRRQRAASGDALDCDMHDVACYKFECSLRELNPGDSVVIYFHARLWNQTISQVYENDVSISSTAQIVCQPSILQTNTSNDILKVTTIVAIDAADATEGIAWWIILIAALSGLLLLALLIFLMWKLDFFKRNRVMGQHQAARVEVNVEEEEEEKTALATEKN